MGRSRGGTTTQLLALTDRTGRFVKFKLKPGNAAESTELATLLGSAPSQTRELLGDKAYDSHAVRAFLDSVDIIATIPARTHRIAPIPHDCHAYKARHLVENAFLDIKQFRGIATRYCKLAQTFAGLLNLVMWFVGSKSQQRGPSPYYV